MIVGVDSMVLIYAGIVPAADRSPPPSPQELERFAELQLRAKVLLFTLHREKATIVLPTVAVAELLVPVPQHEKGSVLAALENRFFCRPLDLHAAAVASDLWARYRQLPADCKYDNRHILKSDAFIVGCVTAAGATRFYSHDKNCRKMAELIMEARDLPNRPPDGDMFLMDDLRRGELDTE